MARRRSFRRRFHRPRFRRGHMKQSLPSKITSAAALLIGLSPVIAIGKDSLQSGDFQGFGTRVAEVYSAGLSKGSFNWNDALYAYGPLVGAILFKKGTSYLLKIAKLKF